MKASKIKRQSLVEIREMAGHDVGAGITQLNRENEAARFEEALAGYFRVATPSRKRGRGGARPMRLHTEQEETESPASCLKRMKQILRDANQSQRMYVQRIFSNILHQLKRGKSSPTVFNRAIELCREIFKRSVAFRALVSTQTASFFDQLLMAAGDDPNANVSRALRAKHRGSPQLTMVLELIETWKQDFGAKYPSIVAGHAVLIDRGYVFPRARERQRDAQQQAANTRSHRDRVSDAKKRQRDREMAQFIPEMEQVLVEMNRIFEILVPTLDAFQLSDNEAEAPAAVETKAGETLEKIDAVESGNESDAVQWEEVSSPAAQNKTGDEEDDDVEWETVSAADGDADQEQDFNDVVQGDMDINDIVQAYGLGSSSYQLTIEVPKRVCEESADNDVLFRSLEDCALRMRKRFLPLLDDWEQHSTLSPHSSSNSSSLQSQRDILQQIRDLRDRMTRALLKCDDLVQDNNSTHPVSAVVSVPLDAYNPPAKKRRQQ